MANNQDHKCFVCQQEPTKGRLCIEHEHVKGWRHLLPEHRKLFIRGLACFLCNTQYLGRGLTIERAKRVVMYLENYLVRRPAEVPKPPSKKKKTKSKQS